MKQEMKKILLSTLVLAGVLASAQVGINTEEPQATLTVKSKTDNGKNLELENASNTKLVTVLDNGNVGIGTVNPTEKLEVAGRIRTIVRSNVGPTFELVNPLKDQPEQAYIWRIYNMTDSELSNPYKYTNGLHFWAYDKGNNLGSKMLISDRGNVGIGIGGSEEPTAKLDINGNARVRKMLDATELESTYTKAVVADNSGNLAVVSRVMPTIPHATETIFGDKVATDIMKGETFYSIQQNNDNRGKFYFRNIGSSITLPPGKWIVYGGFLLYLNLYSDSSNILENVVVEGNKVISENLWIRTIISENPNDENTRFGDLQTANVVDSPEFLSLSVTPGQRYNFSSGLWLVDNNTNAPKTYYIKSSIEASGFLEEKNKKIYPMSRYREDYIIAIRRK